MRLAALPALLAAVLLLGGCGGDEVEDRGEESPQDFTVSQVIERPPLPSETVGVIGEARPLEDFGFELSDGEGNAILVRGGEDEVEPGQQVRVVGTVRRITQPLSTEIANRLEGTPDIGARTSQGAVYLEFERLADGSY